MKFEGRRGKIRSRRRVEYLYKFIEDSIYMFTHEHIEEKRDFVGDIRRDKEKRKVDV